MITERKIFTGGINSDDVADFIEQGDCLVAQNVRAGRDESGGGKAVKPVDGTTLRSSTEHTGSKRVIQSITDEEKGRVYWFLWHSGSQHWILAYDRASGMSYVVLKSIQLSSGLNFSSTQFVNGVALIGDYLYWTDNLNQPRRINVERGIRTNHPTYISPDGTTPVPYELPLLEYDITVARRQPKLPPTRTKVDSEDLSDLDDIISNRIALESFQFAYRYISREGETSTLSPYSKLANINLDVSRNDAIRVEIPLLEGLENEIYEVEFLVRSGNVGVWYVFEKYSRRDDEAIFDAHNAGTANMSVYFIGNKLAALADAESGVPFHDVPLLSKGLEIAQNRLFLANNLKGYDYPGAVGLTATLGADINPAVGYIFGGAEYILVTAECLALGTTHSVILVKLTLPVELQGYYYLYHPSPATAFGSLALPDDLYIDADILTGLFAGSIEKVAGIDELVNPQDFFDLAVEILGVSGCGGYGRSSLVDETYGGDQPKILNVSSTGERGIVMEDSIFKMGVVYFDEYGRNAGVAPGDVITISTGVDAVAKDGIDWQLPAGTQLNIPNWATHYSIVRTNNLLKSFFLKGVTVDVKYAKDVAGELDYTDTLYDNADTLYVAVNIGRLTQESIGYIKQEGDVLVLYKNGATYRMGIVGQEGDWLLCEAKDVGDTSGITSLLFTIYTPKNDSGEDVFYEVGATYLVSNPKTALRAFSTLSGTIEGDAVLLPVRSDGITITSPYDTLWLSRMSPNNKKWTSWNTDIGRPYLVTYSEQKRYDTEIASSGAYFPGTKINDLNAFLSADTETLDSAIGAVQKLVYTARTAQYGTVMLAIGSSDVASIYLGRTEYYDSAEQANVMRSADLIGTVNVLRGGFGTMNPESVVENDGDVYWFSAVKGAFVRYNLNGVAPISNKFSVFSKWLGDKILNAVKGQDFFFVMGGFDEFNNEYLASTPIDSVRSFPLTYPTLEDMNEEVALTGDDAGSSRFATLEAGMIYEFTWESTSNLLITVNDLYFGSVSKILAGDGSFQFVAGTNGFNSFPITITPAAGTHSLTLVKKRLNPYVQVNYLPKTVAFSEESKKWRNYSFVPDCFGRVGSTLLSFKNGILYSHDNASQRCRFYGINYKPWISFPLNQNPNIVKKYRNVAIESDIVPDYVHLRTDEYVTQSTDILGSEFERLEGVFYADFKQDRLSPNADGTYFDAMLTGDDMKARIGKILFEWTFLSNFVARIFTINSRASTGHKT